VRRPSWLGHLLGRLNHRFPNSPLPWRRAFGFCVLTQINSAFDGSRMMDLRSQSRSFTLRHDVDQAKAEAKYQDGILELTLPKHGGTPVKELTVP
jgi:hypothetical protein